MTYVDTLALCCNVYVHMPLHCSAKQQTLISGETYRFVGTRKIIVRGALELNFPPTFVIVEIVCFPPSDFNIYFIHILV